MATKTFASLRGANLGQCYSSVISRTFKQKNNNNNASIVFLHCFRSTFLKIKDWRKIINTPVHDSNQAMVSVNMPQAIWSSHRIRSPRNYYSLADSRVSRVNAVNTLPDSFPLNSETYNDRRCPVTKEYPNKVPWSLIKRCTRLSTCSSEIIEQSVISSSPCNVYVQLCMFGVFCLCSTPSYNRPSFVQNRAGAGT